MDSNEWRDNVEGDAMLLTTEEASLLIQFLQEWRKYQIAVKNESCFRRNQRQFASKEWTNPSLFAKRCQAMYSICLG